MRGKFNMNWRGISAGLAAGIAFAMVTFIAVFSADEPAPLEAVPAPPLPAVQASLPALARDGLRSSAASLNFDPYSAETPEVGEGTPGLVASPTAPATIVQESMSQKVADRAPGKLLTRPVDGRKSSGFGFRFHPVLRIWKLHSGLDLATDCGTPVGAAAPGTVVKTGWAGGNGVQVKVDHGLIAGKRVVTTYNHLSSIGVSVGQKVDTLDGLGRVGNTGYSTGCHLHFEVIVNGAFTDPEPWLNGEPTVVDLSQMTSSLPVPSAMPSSTASVLPSSTLGVSLSAMPSSTTSGPVSGPPTWSASVPSAGPSTGKPSATTAAPVTPTPTGAPTRTETWLPEPDRPSVSATGSSPAETSAAPSQTGDPSASESPSPSPSVSAASSGTLFEFAETN